MTLRLDDVAVMNERGEAIVRGVSLEVAAGTALGLVGPNGSGKSSVLRVVTGLIPIRPPPSRLERTLWTAGSDERRWAHGVVLVAGQDVSATHPSERRVSLVRQDNALLPFRTAHENIALPLRLRSVARDPAMAAAAEAADMLGVTRWLKRYPPELSGGVQQRVSIARALVNQPRVLLLDEPFASLDVEAREEALETLGALVRVSGVASVLVTHRYEEAARFCSKVAFLEGGRVHQTATLAEAWERPASPFVAQMMGYANVVEGTFDADGRFVPTESAGGWNLAPPPETKEHVSWLAGGVTMFRAVGPGVDGVRGTVVGHGFVQGVATARVRLSPRVVVECANSQAIGDACTVICRPDCGIRWLTQVTALGGRT